jgi:hypothetical protein
MAAPTNFEIGATLIGMADIVTAGIIEPMAEFYEYAEEISLANGQRRAYGLPRANWTFAYLTAAQYDALRAYATGASGQVYIATLNNDSEFVRYSCIMLPPPRYTIRIDRPTYRDVTIEFRYLVEAE